jgi:hypothetical protein
MILHFLLEGFNGVRGISGCSNGRLSFLFKEHILHGAMYIAFDQQQSLQHTTSLSHLQVTFLPRGMSDPSNGGKRVEGKWSELQTVREGVITVRLEA